jgi:hypothetical protein
MALVGGSPRGATVRVQSRYLPGGNAPRARAGLPPSRTRAIEARCTTMFSRKQKRRRLRQGAAGKGVWRDLIPRVLLLYAALYASFGLSSPFLPAFLSARDLGPEWLGFLLGAGTAVRLASAPLAGRLADVFGAFRLELCQSFSVPGWQNIGGLRASEINLPAIRRPQCAPPPVSRATPCS